MMKSIRDHARYIGITMGCPVGVGPEIIVRFLSERSRHDGFCPVVLGDATVLERCVRENGSDVGIVPWEPGKRYEESAINVLSLSQFGSSLTWGEPNVATGKAMALYIEEAVRLARKDILAALVTCPITKSALNAAGYNFPGHTEMLAERCGVNDFAMMMAGKTLRVTLVTIHTALSDVPAMVRQDEVARLISITGRSLMQDFGIVTPRIAVAGLNPHAGENGLFGKEEEREIVPAINAAVRQGWHVSGPLPPDTVFLKAVAGEFDAVVCMYHDQGLIPFKLLHFKDGVNVTLGLPIVRTSVDHGTAYDIAGKGIADTESLAAAYRMAGEIATSRLQN